MSMHSDPATYHGRLSDGRTAATMPVQVRCAEAGLELVPVGPSGPTGTPLTWPYDTLRSGVPLRPDAPEVLVSHRAGADTVFIADPAFARSLSLRAPSLAPGRQRLAGVRVGAIAVALVAAIACMVWYLDLRPMQSVARLIPQGVRDLMGRNVVASLTSQLPVCETEAGRAVLDRMTQRLLAAASDPPLSLGKVSVVDWGIVNAFAAPGGHLILTRGLLAKAGSPEEIAGVLAHELGHTLELHPETGVIRSMALGLAANLLVAGSGGSSNLGLMLVQLRYTRQAEGEADAHAMRILKNAGISPKGFADFFERVAPKSSPGKEKANNAESRFLTIFSTHPLSKARLALVQAQPPYPVNPVMSDSDWQALRQICGLPGARQRQKGFQQRP